MGEPIQIDYEELDLKANLGAFSTYDAEVLVPQVMKLGVGDVYLEVGVDKGKSLSIARMVNDKCKVIGVDLRPDPKVPNTFFYQGDSVGVSKVYDKGEISVLFIDGDHSYQGCKRDIDAWFPLMKEGGVMLFHDGDETSPGVVRAIAEFVDTYKGVLKEWTICKRTDKNTSMQIIRL